jgi:hypothetical protein
MKEVFNHLKALITGKWKGEGFAKFPTITATHYSEMLDFEPDASKDIIRFEQKTWYKNQTPDNGKTVFWDTGFILLKEDKILLISAQSGGRVETYELNDYNDNRLTFESTIISNDRKTIRSQRIFQLSDTSLSYELNMSTKQAAAFQNHLTAHLGKIYGDV